LSALRPVATARFLMGSEVRGIVGGGGERIVPMLGRD